MLELMIGIIIVGILATLAIPNFSKAIEKTKVKDAQTTLAALYSAEKVYRLDQNAYGTLGNLIANHYITDPNAGNTTWGFADGEPPTAATFKITATRTGGGWNGGTVSVDENFTGTNYTSTGYPPELS